MYGTAVALLAVGAAAPPRGPTWPEPMTVGALDNFLRIGSFAADGVVAGRPVRFRGDGDGHYASATGGDRLDASDGAFFLAAADGTRWRFEESEAGRRAMLENQRGGGWTWYRAVAADFRGGERRRWDYETRTLETDCGPVGRFGLTNPRCQSQTRERPAAVMSSRGVALAARYRSDQADAAFTRLAGIDLYDTRACRFELGWIACRPQAQPLRRTPIDATLGARD